MLHQALMDTQIQMYVTHRDSNKGSYTLDLNVYSLLILPYFVWNLILQGLGPGLGEQRPLKDPLN